MRTMCSIDGRQQWFGDRPSDSTGLKVATAAPLRRINIMKGGSVNHRQRECRNVGCSAAFDSGSTMENSRVYMPASQL